MCFLRNGSSYSFETCTIAIGMPENLRVHWVWPSKYKGKWCFSPKCVFSETGHHTESLPFQSAKTVFGQIQKKVCFSPKCVFSEMDHHTALKLVPLWLACLKTSGCRVWPSKYKGKWCFSPKCVFSETDHHTALKLVPLHWACLKTSGCTEFGPLNTKESDVLAQNVFSQKFIKQLWNLYHWIAAKTSGCAEFGPLIQRKVMF